MKTQICRNISVSHFSWFHGLSRLVNDGPPRIESDHQTVNHWRSDGRLRILHFLQHCMRTAELTWTCSSTPLWLSPPHSWFWRGQHCSHAPPLRWVVTGASVTMASVGTHCPPAAGTGQTYPAQTLHTYRNYAIWMRHDLSRGSSGLHLWTAGCCHKLPARIIHIPSIGINLPFDRLRFNYISGRDFATQDSVGRYYNGFCDSSLSPQWGKDTQQGTGSIS